VRYKSDEGISKKAESGNKIFIASALHGIVSTAHTVGPPYHPDGAGDVERIN
jgi:hypothetical protein